MHMISKKDLSDAEMDTLIEVVEKIALKADLIRQIGNVLLSTYSQTLNV